VQEGRAQEAVRLLRSRLRVVARVRRDGRWQALPAELATGALAYAGATVARGEASGEVMATGASTYFRRTAELVRTARAGSHLEGVIVRIVRVVIVLDIALAAIVVSQELATGARLATVLQFAAVLLLGSVPVALPATFTLAAALGSLELARRGVLAARLSAIEEAAGMDVLCVDKTGTITQNLLRLADVHAYEPATRTDVLEPGRALPRPRARTVLAESAQPPARGRFRARSRSRRHSRARRLVDGRCRPAPARKPALALVAGYTLVLDPLKLRAFVRLGLSRLPEPAPSTLR
jgi:magnesium-transporting ATPase (P-type)